MSLTFAQINSAKPRRQNYKLTDSNGLFLLVASNGLRSWRYKYRIRGREKLFTIGRYPQMGLADARVRHGAARKLVTSGKDPAAEARKRKDAQIAADQAIFSKIAEAWLQDQALLWSPSNAFRVRSRLEKDIYPALGHLPIGEIDGPMVLAAIRKIEARGSIETTKRVRGYLKQRAVLRKAWGELISQGLPAPRQLADQREQ